MEKEEKSNRMSRSAGRMIGRLREKGIGVVWSGWDAGYCIAEVSACADFSLLRCLSSVIMPLWGFWPGRRPVRMFVCRKAWTSVSVAARRTEERVSVRQESVRINAFKKNVCRPTHIARDRASAERSAWQSYTFICIWQIVSSRHVVSVLGWVML